jgi:hypothetical protein
MLVRPGFRVKDKETLEKIQRGVVNTVSGLQGASYEGKLMKLNRTSLD